MVYVTRVLYIGTYIRMTVHDGRGRSNVKIDIGPSGEAFIPFGLMRAIYLILLLLDKPECGILTKVTRPLRCSIRGGFSRKEKFCTTVGTSRAPEIEKIQLLFCSLRSLIESCKEM